MAVDKLVDSAQLDGYFTNIASAIRSKAGVSSTYTPSEMPQAIEDIPSGGGGEDLDKLVDRTITEASGNATVIGDYVFARCSSLTTVSFPSAKYISTSAFYRCYNLLSFYLMGSSVASLANVNAFASTPISNYTSSTGGVHGSIFVPASLYNSYLTAANWSLYSSRIVSVAESTKARSVYEITDISSALQRNSRSN